MAPAGDKSVVHIDGARLETGVWPGRGTPILMLHEGLGSLSMWRDFPEQLAAATQRPVIAWSRRGYGHSDRLSGPRAPDYMHREAALVPQLMDALGIERAVLFGHSDGASIALIAASNAPGRIAGLILEAPHVLVEPLTIASIESTKMVYETTDLASKLARHHRDADHSFWGWSNIWLDPTFRGWNIEDCLPAVAAPALLIQGMNDEYGTLDQLDRIERALTETRRLELANCGHSPHRDQTEAVLKATAEYLRTLNI